MSPPPTPLINKMCKPQLFLRLSCLYGALRTHLTQFLMDAHNNQTYLNQQTTFTPTHNMRMPTSNQIHKPQNTQPIASQNISPNHFSNNQTMETKKKS